MLYRKDQGIKLTKIQTKSKDMFFTTGIIGKWEINIIVIYFSVNDKERSNEMRKEIERIIEGKEEPLLITGDFNGHVGLTGDQKLDTNGKMILEWMEKYRLIMLNDDERCKGVYTWNRGEQKSVIDFALINEQMYEKFQEMSIDEEKEEIDLSDHNLLEICCRVDSEKKKYSKEWTVKKYYRTDNESLKEFREEMEKQGKEKKTQNMKELEERIEITANKTLKSKYKRKQRKNTEEREPVWMTEQIRTEIKERKRRNKKRRNTVSKEEQEKRKRMYEEQKHKTQEVIREEIINMKKK